MQDAAEYALLGVMTQRVTKALDATRKVNWLPSGPATSRRSSYVEELVLVLQVRVLGRCFLVAASKEDGFYSPFCGSKA